MSVLGVRRGLFYFTSAGGPFGQLAGQFLSELGLGHFRWLAISQLRDLLMLLGSRIQASCSLVKLVPSPVRLWFWVGP